MPGCVEGGGQPLLREPSRLVPGCVCVDASSVFRFQVFAFAFVVGGLGSGLGFEFCVFDFGWRHALRSEWPFIIIITFTCNNTAGLRDSVRQRVHDGRGSGRQELRVAGVEGGRGSGRQGFRVVGVQGGRGSGRQGFRVAGVEGGWC